MVVAKTLRICEILYENGIDFTNYKLTSRRNGKTTYIKLEDIEGIDIDQIIKENGLSEDTEIGKMIIALRQAYNDTAAYPITPEQKRKAELIPRINPRQRNGNCKNIKDM